MPVRLPAAFLRFRAVAAVLAGFAGAAASAPPPEGGCPKPLGLVQRFLSADCTACWAAAEPPAPRALVLDWIVPSAAGDAAPMALAALPEAAARAARAGTLAPDRTLAAHAALPASPGLALRIADGPAWSGYVGLQFEARRVAPGPLPPGAAGYLAVVERVAAGDEGSGSDRQLVRTLIGPLPLEGLATAAPVLHLRATRLPESARPERLSSVGWIETPDGSVLAAAAAGCRAAR